MTINLAVNLLLMRLNINTALRFTPFYSTEKVTVIFSVSIRILLFSVTVIDILVVTLRACYGAI